MEILPHATVATVVLAMSVVLTSAASCGGQAASPHDRGSGGAANSATSLGGATGPAGGAQQGGGSGLSEGGSGGSSTTGACVGSWNSCLLDCLEERGLPDSAVCVNGDWTCRSGYVLSSSCPKRACAVTPNACCDTTTGAITENPCTADGYRPICPGGAETRLGVDSQYCVPLSLQNTKCISLDAQPCSGPAVRCNDMSAGFVDCMCFGLDSDAATGTWRCSSFIGP